MMPHVYPLGSAFLFPADVSHLQKHALPFRITSRDEGHLVGHFELKHDPPQQLDGHI